MRDVTFSLAPCFFEQNTFLLTRPMRDVTHRLVFFRTIFIFLLTRPMRDVTGVSAYDSSGNAFLLTRPMRDVTCNDSVYSG